MTILNRLLHPSARPIRAVRKKVEKTEKADNPYQAVAELAGTLRHHQEMPIRFQREWLAAFLVGVILLGLVAGLYLNVSARAAITGREIQSLEAEIAANKRDNADLQTHIAILLSNQSLSQRARALGFEPVKRDDVEYIVVPGYFPPQGINFVQPTIETDLLATKPEYSESLFDWLGRQIEAASRPLR
jgi:cell division protein FtsL